MDINNIAIKIEYVFGFRYPISREKIKESLKEYRNFENLLLEYRIENFDICKIFEIINDSVWTQNILRSQKFLFSDEIKIQLIKNHGKEFILKCLEDEEIKLTDSERISLLLIVGEFKRLKEMVPGKYDISEITLPLSLTIGIEIETEGDLFKRIVIERMTGEDTIITDENGKKWSAKGDTALDDDTGVEVSSPVFTANDNEDIENIYTMCEVLKKAGHKSKEGCSGHIHIGAKYLTTKQSYMNLLKMIASTEDLLYLMTNEVGQIPRENTERYANPVSNNIGELVESGFIDIKSEEDLDEFIKKIKEVNEGNKGKKYSVNFTNIKQSSNEKNTIEFRMPNGTLSPELWIQNINLFGGIVEISEELAQIQSKPENERTEDEKKKLLIFECLSDHSMTDKQRIMALLVLTVKNNKKQYIERYLANKKAMQVQNSQMYEEIYNPGKYARGIFAKISSATSQDVEDAKKILEDLERDW